MTPLTPAELRVWLYDVDQDGMSRAMWQTGGLPMKTLSAGGTLHVSVEGGQDTPAEKYLKPPPAVGMASEPVTVRWEPHARFWMIRNSGRTNTLRVQQYGLAAVPLPPQSEMPMCGTDVAVWIPVKPRSLRRNENGEGFRLLILAAKEPAALPGETQRLTYPRVNPTPATQEALIAYFGSHLSWPPLPAPHVRQQSEVEDIARRHGLRRDQALENWARNRHDVLAGPDGLFKTADWYPNLGGKGRTLANHLSAFHRLVELGTIKLYRVQRWANQHDVKPYVIIDEQLGRSA